MPRGKMLHTILYKEAEKVAVVKLAELMAKDKFDRKRHKLNEKNLYESLREHLGHFLDRVTVQDAMDIAAVAGLAYIIRPVLIASDELRQRMASLDEILYKLMKGKEQQTGLKGQADILYGIWGFLKLSTPWFEPLVVQFLPVETTPPDELNTWVFSFIIALLIVKLGPSMIEAFGGTVSKLALGLLA